METATIRGAKVLLPSEDDAPVTSWPFASPSADEKVANIDFRGVDLGSHRLVDISLERCRFTGSRLMGVSMTRTSLKDVLFEGCRFDYSTWDQVKVNGAVAFVNCSFRETGIARSDLRGAVFDECAFGPEITSTKMSGTDLRGSDLSGLSGLPSLVGAQVTETQLRQLTEAMVRDLKLAVAEISP
ncbi:pentapeptide repeat-containing protein [Nocardiopsis sp. YSL2]|uniref:pentapeptide repeat-containing protein n=1 Tax=Nocardiopsis sp. YSL2 TaxID=2939492 RepID=UPI0026F41623|nr:pentapeptide repeat-containing protein [Nocardiopsis sp. YSL2]